MFLNRHTISVYLLIFSISGIKYVRLWIQIVYKPLLASLSSQSLVCKCNFLIIGTDVSIDLVVPTFKPKINLVTENCTHNLCKVSMPKIYFKIGRTFYSLVVVIRYGR